MIAAPPPPCSRHSTTHFGPLQRPSAPPFSLCFCLVAGAGGRAGVRRSAPLERGDLQLFHDVTEARYTGRHRLGVVGVFEPWYATAQVGDPLLDQDLDGEIGRRRVLPQLASNG